LILLWGYNLGYTFFGLYGIARASTYTRSISYTPAAKRRASKVGLCPTSACSIFFCKKWTLLKQTETGLPAAPVSGNLLLLSRPLARQVEWDEGSQELPDPLTRLGADAFDFGEVAVEFTAFEIGYDFGVLHNYLI